MKPHLINGAIRVIILCVLISSIHGESTAQSDVLKKMSAEKQMVEFYTRKEPSGELEALANIEVDQYHGFMQHTLKIEQGKMDQQALTVFLQKTSYKSPPIDFTKHHVLLFGSEESPSRTQSQRVSIIAVALIAGKIVGAVRKETFSDEHTPGGMSPFVLLVVPKSTVKIE